MVFLLPKLMPAALVLGLLLIPSLTACSRDGQLEISLDVAANEKAVQIGVLVTDNIDTTRRQYEPLFQELKEALGRPVTFVPLTPQSQFLMVKADKVDFVISNPLASVQMRRLYTTELLATLSRPRTGSESGGAIVVRSNSPITTVTDLKGKRGACVSMSSAAAGCLFQLFHLQQKQLDPLQSLESLKEIPAENDIVEAVIAGEIDFGFISAGHLEQMVEQGELSRRDAVRVLEPIEDSYPLPRTTQLYPDWAIAAVHDAPADLVTTVQQVLLNLPAGDAALAEANIQQWVPPHNYGEIDALIEALRLTSATAQ